jgi:hypothetical protein
MKKYIILSCKTKKGLKVDIVFASQSAACNKEGNLLLFNSIDEADYYREQEAIDGQIVEIPIY